VVKILLTLGELEVGVGDCCTVNGAAGSECVKANVIGAFRRALGIGYLELPVG
jgi:hypothetical protein